MSNITKEYIATKSLIELPRFDEFLDDLNADGKQVCPLCVAFDVDDEVLNETSSFTKEELFHKYQDWYREQN